MPFQYRPPALRTLCRTVLLRLVVPVLVVPVLALLLCLSAAPLAADPASPWVENPHLKLRLVSAQTAVGAGDPVRLGVQILLEPGWTFYWRNPGDNGLAPLLDWSGSRNAASVEVDWPAPLRKELLGGTNFVYAEEVVLPVAIRADDPDLPLVAELLLDYGVCREVCVPYSDRLRAELPPGQARPTAAADLIDYFAGLVPAAASVDGLHVAAAWTDLEQGLLVLRISAARALVAPDLVVEGPAGIWFGPPQVVLGTGGREAQVSFRVGPPAMLEALDGEELRITIVDLAQAVEDRVAVAPQGGR